MSEALRVERSDDVVTIVLDRPERRNALDADLWETLAEALRAVASDRSVRCLVLTGSGTAFASGGDLKKLLAELSERDGPRRFRERIQACFDVLYEFPVPTVARVNGPAIGGGLELSVACDLRVASREARFGMPAVRFGMVMACADLVRLAAVVGPGQARRLVLTGEVISAEEAYRIGLVHVRADVGDLDRATERVVKQLTGAEPKAVSWSRRALDRVVLGGDTTDLVAFEEECLTTAEFRRRVEEFLAR